MEDRFIGFAIAAALALAAGCSAGESPGRDAGADGDADADADLPGDDADRDEGSVADADEGEPADADDIADADAIDAEPDVDVDAEEPPITVDCLIDAYLSPPPIRPDYEPFGPVMGSHCVGTNHQDFVGVERVVFLGDSVTVGSPPTLASGFYRSLLADMLAARFGLHPPGMLWKSLDLVEGTSLVRTSGDFACCAKWGARTDDLLRDSSQIADCFPESERHKTTLVIMTVGGNDISSITQAGLDGVPIPEIWDQTREFVGLMRDAVEWFYEDPARFPGGVYVVFANMFEFTDGTGDVTACPAAGLAGFGAAWDDPDALTDLVIWAEEQYLSIAVETGTDMVFALEAFCGHGFNHDDPTAPCYRGPTAPRWFDATCIHPNPLGHASLADIFFAVVEE